MSNQNPRVLLLTGSPPGERGVGQIIVREIYQHFPPQNLFCFATLTRHEEYRKPDELQDAVVEVSHRRFEHQFRPFGRLAAPVTQRLSYWLNFRRHCNRLAKQAIEFGRKHKCELVFSILENATTMQITDPVAVDLGVPKHVLVWDAPDYIGSKPGAMPHDLRSLNDAFSTSMSNADRLAVVSDPMARRYKSEFGLESVMLRHVASPVKRDQRRNATRDDTGPFVIGFAGSVTAKPQLDLLQRALDQLGWQIEGREIRLDLYGLRFVMQSRCARNVRYCGYRTVKETVQALAETADVLFMPQPFDKQSASFTELSFPTKLSTYFAARRPILLLSPEQSSLGEFIQKHPFGTWCRTMEVEPLLSSLTSILTDAELAESTIQCIDELLENSFSLGHFRTQVHRFLSLNQ
ncbi:MAG: hypothetical protein AAF802_24265 [Planctomycetota bacterium]